MELFSIFIQIRIATVKSTLFMLHKIKKGINYHETRKGSVKLLKTLIMRLSFVTE